MRAVCHVCGIFALVLSLFYASITYSQGLDERWKHLEISTQQDFLSSLQSVRVPLSAWIQNLNENPIDFLCLGERHDASLRAELARQVFPFLKFDVLFLEAVPEKARELVTETQNTLQSDKLQQIGLLGAPIGPLLQPVLQTAHHLEILGVEQTAHQKRELNLLTAQGTRTLTRDSYIARNILDEWTSGKRHVALYGASHCAKINVDSGWMRPFYPMLAKSQPNAQMRSVKIIVEQEGSVPQSNTPEGLLMIYLQSSGFADASFVITDTSRVPPEVYNSKDELLGLFSAYDVIVYLKRSK